MKAYLKKSIGVNNLRIIVETLKKRPQGAERYVKNKLESYGIEVKKSKKKKGTPDFRCIYEGKIFYVEVKGWNDSLRISQIEWIQKHPKSLVYLYCLKKGWRHYSEFL